MRVFMYIARVDPMKVFPRKEKPPFLVAERDLWRYRTTTPY
jgi:hypothetical protein